MRTFKVAFGREGYLLPLICGVYKANTPLVKDIENKDIYCIFKWINEGYVVVLVSEDHFRDAILPEHSFKVDISLKDDGSSEYYRRMLEKQQEKVKQAEQKLNSAKQKLNEIKAQVPSR